MPEGLVILAHTDWQMSGYKDGEVGGMAIYLLILHCGETAPDLDLNELESVFSQLIRSKQGSLTMKLSTCRFSSWPWVTAQIFSKIKTVDSVLCQPHSCLSTS